jgi:hypothetical protein
LQPKRDAARGASVNILIGMPGAPIGPDPIDLSPVAFDVAPASPTRNEQQLAAEVVRLQTELAKATRR